MDFVGPLPTTPRRNKYLLVITDYLTRWPEAFAVKDCTAATAARIFVDQIFSRYGAPREIVTDQGTNFTGKVFTETMEMLGILTSGIACH